MTKPHDTRPTILLTGFGPFPGVAKNVSAELIEALALVAAKRFPKRQVIAHVLPTEWQTAPVQLAALYKLHAPMLVLHFGVSLQATGFRIETQAHNTHGPIADDKGAHPVKTLGGCMLTAKMMGDKITLTDENGSVATVTIADVKQSNGVIHVIDTVMLPKM